MPNRPDAIARDIEAIRGISAVPALLRFISSFTGMGFAAVARVTDETWTACAVLDTIGLGLQPGSQLQLETTLCNEARLARAPVAIDEVATDPIYKDHHTPRLYGFQSYISVPILRKDGGYFGNLCAIDPKPASVANESTLTMFRLFGELIALQLESEDRHQAAETALLDARSAADVREQFIAVLGHDLRNPVAAVAATAELLVRQQEGPRAVQLGERLRHVARRMAGLLDDVMDFARGRLGSGMGVTIERHDDLALAIDDVVDELQAANPTREIYRAIAISGPVVCDRGRIQQLMSNLLGNALAHGEAETPIVVEASVEDGLLCVAVANGGEAIHPDSLGKVFEPYWRPAHSKPGGGLGLGLFICSQIVAAHRGTIDVTSTLESGTRFKVRIPAG